MTTLESVVVEEAKIHDRPAIDREKTCPLLLRVFCSTGHHNALDEYGGGQVPANELQIYTWMDATLKELSGLVKEVNPDARRAGTQFEFAAIYPEIGRRQNGYRSRIIGITVSGSKSLDDNRTLSQCRFNIGDYMDIAITPPSRVIPGRRPGGRY